MSDPTVPVPSELELNGQHYRFAPISARTQLHIMRRIAPLNGITVLSGGRLMHMARILSEMPEEDVNYILDKCLASISRRSGDGWASVMAASGATAFADIDAVGQFKLAQHAIRIFQDPFFKMLADVMPKQQSSGSTEA